MVGIVGVGLFFGAMLTSLTAFMVERGDSDRAGLLYGVMGIGSAILALGVAALPARFTLRARWLLFSGILVGALLLLVHDVPGMILALAIMGIGIGPTLVTQYSFGAVLSPAGRSATVMTMLDSGVIVGQSTGAAVTGAVAQSAGASWRWSSPASRQRSSSCGRREHRPPSRPALTRTRRRAYPSAGAAADSAYRRFRCRAPASPRRG